MRLLSGDLSRTNSVFLLLATPLLIRIWIESVVWRLTEGPQMVGFQVMHLSAGMLAVPLFLSLLSYWLYQIWAIVIALRSLSTRGRALSSGKRAIAGGVGSIMAFLFVGDALQTDLTHGFILAGAVLMAVLLTAVLWLAVRPWTHIRAQS